MQSFDAVIEAMQKGQAVDLSGLPPSPGQGEISAITGLYFSQQAKFKLILTNLYALMCLFSEALKNRS